MDAKLLAKKQALMGMSSKLKAEARSPMKEELASKKKMKVIIEAPDEKSAMEGLSKAQELLRAKFGSLGLDEGTMEELDGEEIDCPACNNEGCDECYESEEAEEILE